ncbi:YopX family protein [uncultured Selenomonas sp.]|uniref:YopX family protein n=1 Tax=uncultured Selenomonas sp. TaxID=159275 RepID=UPI0028E67726|nr:YopX family protein [uncultured Selenomonas sp.]
MREIKFRAWDLKTKKMHTAENINFCGRKTVTVQYNPVKKICLDSAILMQYTGVKDKNGVEIYEGDIIRGHTGRYKVDCVVRWSSGNCGFIAVPTITERTYLCLNPGSTKSYEVIGNIYENPELVSNEADT